MLILLTAGVAGIWMHLQVDVILKTLHTDTKHNKESSQTEGK